MIKALELKNINKKLEYGYPGNTILHEILYYNSTFCLNYILTLEPDFSITNKDGNNPLHIACLNGNYDIVYKFIKHGANIVCKNNKGDTCLHCAVRSGSYNCVLIVINNGGGALLNEKNFYGETPLHLCASSKKKNFKISF